MKFRVIFGIRPNMFGRIGGKTTLISDDKSTSVSINWFISRIIGEFVNDITDKEEVKKQKSHLNESIKKLKMGEVAQIVNKDDRPIAFVERVDESMTLADIIDDAFY